MNAAPSAVTPPRTRYTSLVIAYLLPLSTALIASYSLARHDLVQVWPDKRTSDVQGLTSVSPSVKSRLHEGLPTSGEPNKLMAVSLHSPQAANDAEAFPLLNSTGLTHSAPSAGADMTEITTVSPHAVLLRTYLLSLLSVLTMGLVGSLLVIRLLQNRIAQQLSALRVSTTAILETQYRQTGESCEVADVLAPAPATARYGQFRSGITTEVHHLNHHLGALSRHMGFLSSHTADLKQELRTCKQQLYDLFYSSLVAILIEDSQGCFVDANPALLQLLKYDLETLPNKSWHDIVHPDSHPELDAFMSLLESRNADNNRVETQLMISDASGDMLWIHIAGQYLQNNASQRLYFITDITARINHENQLRLAAVAFETQEAILVASADTHILRVNSAFSRITGYSADEAVGRKTNLLQSGQHDRRFYQQMWSTLALEGRWQGEIWNRKKDGVIYPQWQTITAVKGVHGQVTHYIACFEDLSERKQAEDEIKQLAYFDELTGLPNRRMFYQRLQQALAACKHTQNHGALLFIDLDHFKDVNDSLGHLLGDQLLQEVALRLNQVVRAEDTLARLGGDEFVVIMENLSPDYEDAALVCQALAERLIEQLRQDYPIDQQVLHISASVGISLFPTDAANIDGLLRQADIAMYRSKEGGRATLRFFSEEMQIQATERLEMRRDLERAIRDNQFELFLQPQISLENNEVIGSECLIRWNHPQQGLLSPDRFLGIAEESELIVEIGTWTLRQACRIQHQLKAQGICCGRLAVNIHPRHFHKPDFVDEVLTTIRQHNADPRLLCIEITESVAIGNLQDAAEKIQRLQDARVLVAIDDFGTGYSSLSYLVNLQARELKLDRSFIIQLEHNNRAWLMVHSILDLARKLQIQVIAEGVETIEQRELLHQLGCQIIQGYLESRPLSIKAFCSYIQTRNSV